MTKTRIHGDVIRPQALRVGDTIGIFTPSYPANVAFRSKYSHGRRVLHKMGFHVVEGELTARGTGQGYRSGTPEARAREFMELFENPDVRALIATIGGSNSSSMIPYLDFGVIAANPKIVCGYSDVTALHMALLTQAKLSGFYGPAVMPSFGEWPDVDDFMRDSFLDATSRHVRGSRKLRCPSQWSNHFRDASSDEWQSAPRRYSPNTGWRTLVPGEARGSAIVANLNTLLALAGTRYFPSLAGTILIIEQMDCRMSREERQLRQLEAMGVLDEIVALLVGKPETYDAEGSPFTYDDLLLEVLGHRRSYPVVTNFDCSHTVPMLTLAQMCVLSVVAEAERTADVMVCEPMVMDDGRP
jgi:muramoyltetrapeptide carboxypeptidase